MVSDDSDVNIILVAGWIILSAFLTYNVNDRAEQISLKIAFFTLKHSRHAFQTHTGINGRARQWIHSTLFILEKLHKNQIPQLDKAIATGSYELSRTSCFQFFTQIIMNFRAGATRTGLTHRPEVVFFAKTENSGNGQTDSFLPEMESFLIFFINGNVEFIHRQAKDTGNEFPGKINCFFFKIVTE